LNNIRQQGIRYALGAVSAIAALLLREGLNPLLGTGNPYHTLWLAVVFSAWYCGIGPSVLTVIIGGFGIWHWFLPLNGSVRDSTQLYGLLGFVVFGVVIIGLGESNRRIIVRRDRAEKELRRAQLELEDRVRERAAALERKTAETVEKAALLDLANDAIFVKATNGKISYWNQGAERLYGWSESEARDRYPAELLRTEYPIPLEEIEGKDTWEGELRQTTRDGNRIVVASRWTTLKNEDGHSVGWMEINTDITARKRAEEATRKLSARILTLQDEERRRIARGLHDSLGQHLAGLKMNLDLLSVDDGARKVVSTCTEIVDACLTETRTISYLLHPPLLDETGFGSAARWYVDGFSQRSAMKVSLQLPPNMDRLRKDVELALFRILQESLTNVHRHSGAAEVYVRLTSDGKKIRLEIEDDGRGIPPKSLAHLIEGGGGGVGIAGMRERMRELGGSLAIQSDSSGTVVRVSVPLAEITAQEWAGQNDKKVV
jgi:PAS domain S-box-containing protein